MATYGSFNASLAAYAAPTPRASVVDEILADATEVYDEVLAAREGVAEAIDELMAGFAAAKWLFRV